MNRHDEVKVWIVVWVNRGFIEEPEIYYVQEAANKRKDELKKNINSDYDELDVFEKTIILKSEEPPFEI